jgi:hypothetical protein
MEIVTYFVNLFSIWVNTFAAPFSDLNMLWIVVPVWLSWLFAEFFQEKVGTSMGNAISNSVVVIWASIDSARETINLIDDGTLITAINIYLRFALIFVIFSYGIFILVLGVRGNPVIRYLGRIREMTYILVMFIPVFYNSMPLTFEHILAAFIFFPLFYIIIEIIDRVIPDPKPIRIDQELSDAKSDKDNNTLKEVADIPQTEQLRPVNPLPQQNPQQPSRWVIPQKRRGSDFWDFKM